MRESKEVKLNNIINDIKDGKEKAFTDLYLMFYTEILEFAKYKAYSSFIKNIVEEIVDDAFVDFRELIRKNKFEFVSEAKLKALIKQIVFFKITKKVREKRDVIDEYDTIDKYVSYQENIEELYSLFSDEIDLFKEADKCLKLLDSVCKDLIYKDTIECLPKEQILKEIPELGSLGNIRKRKYKCMEKLREICFIQTGIKK